MVGKVARFKRRPTFIATVVLGWKYQCAGAQFEGDLGEILALGAEILPYIGLREKWESHFFFKFLSCQHTIGKL